MKKHFVLLGLCTMILTACGPKDPSENLPGKVVTQLEGTSWQLVTAKKGDNCENLPPIMDFLADHKVAGNLGCNLFNTTYQLEGKKLTFANAAVTRRMCDPESMKVEERLTKVLTDTRFVTQDDKGLMFWNEKGELLAQYEPESQGACQ